METQPQRQGRHSLVFSGEGWHRGVIGIVAQRVAERYHRPALVIGVENGVGQGSGRSIRGFHLLDALARSGDLFTRYGGHAQAAGFTLPSDRIPDLETAFESSARDALSPEDLDPVVRVDAEIDLAGLNWNFHQGVKTVEPHGLGNPTPVFASRG